MKKIILNAGFLLLAVASMAQSDKYVNAMKANIAQLDSMVVKQNSVELANNFERIAEAEKTQWLPYYYAALAQINSGYSLVQTQDVMAGGLGTTLDPIADKAEGLLNKAEALSKNNSEIYVVKKMIASLRMMADPMTRYMTYGPQAAQALETAKKLNPNNPRIYYLEGQDKLYTPEQFGGSKTEAKKLFEEALKKYDAFKPESSISPSWGRSTTQYFLTQAQQ